MLAHYQFDALGGADHGWLKAKHHFSFASYHDPQKMSFGELLVINDDIIAPHTGFDTHPHRDMEIITYVRRGAISHKDSTGNEGRTTSGNVQVMSAGTGIFHSEFNHEDEDTNIYQIWIKPRSRGHCPAMGHRRIPPRSGT
jgi:redox-sensitive bicupin YhaK (pirin superfamily)